MKFISFLLLATSALAAPPQPSVVSSVPDAPRVVVLTKDNTININDVIWNVSTIIKKAQELDSRVKSNDPLYLVLNTPGGSIDNGLELIENLHGLHRPVKTISALAASMGFQTVQTLGERLIFENGTLMSHKARGGFFGEFPGQLDSRYQYYLKRVQRLDENAASRTGGKFDLKSYRELIRDEYWCDGKDCVRDGFADEVVHALCDKSLEGTYFLSDRIIYLGHIIEIKYEYANCPTNTDMLSYHLFIDGEPLFKVTDNPNAPTKTSDDIRNKMLSDPYLNYLYNSVSSTTEKKLDTETLELLQQKANELINKRVNKKSNVVYY